MAKKYIFLKVITVIFLLSYLFVLSGCGGGGGGSVISPTPTEGCMGTITEQDRKLLVKHINTAKHFLFKSTVTEEDFNSARSACQSALSICSDSPDANLLSAIIDIGSEIERYLQDVMYEPDSLFPYNVSYRAVNRILKRALQPTADTIFEPLPDKPNISGKISPRFSEPNPDFSEIQAEVKQNTLPVLNDILNKNNKIRSYLLINPDWKFSYPKDPANLALGYNYIDNIDLDVIIGAIRFIRGWMYWGLTYNWDIPDWWKAGGTEDTNGSGYFEPDEYFPPKPFGTIRPNGYSYLNLAKSDISNGLNILKGALESILAENPPAAGGFTLTSFNRY